MFLIDTHCHLNKLNYYTLHKNISDVLNKAKLHDVKAFLSVSTSISDYQNMIALIGHRKNIFFSCGIHPNDTDKFDEIKKLSLFATKDIVIALGETGLDYHYPQSNKIKQQEIFREHIRIGCLKNKPIIVHTRDADEDTINILVEEKADKCSGIIHCFTGKINFAKILLDLGFYISFSGIITFPNATYLREVINYVPLDRILIETDAPYITPVPYRKKENQPAYIYIIAEYLAYIKGLTLEHISEITTSNFIRLFHVNINNK